MVQLADDGGRLFTLYERIPVGTEWEAHDPPTRVEPGVARMADLIARTSEAPTWVLDGDGCVWAAEAVDPSRVQL